MKQFYSFVSLLLIIISVVFFDTRLIPSFPNVYTLIPTCGSGLIILYAEQNTFVGYILSTRLLRWIGLISYSLYLWHQPLLAFLRLHSNQTGQNMFSLSIVVVIVFPLSILSYLFVEQPFRNKHRFSRNQIFVFASMAMVLTLNNGLFLIGTANDRSIAMDKGNDSYLSDLKRYGHWGYVIQSFDPLAAKKKCFSNRKVILIGDSFAADFYNMIIEGNNMKKCFFFVVIMFIHIIKCIWEMKIDNNSSNRNNKQNSLQLLAIVECTTITEYFQINKFNKRTTIIYCWTKTFWSS